MDLTVADIHEEIRSARAVELPHWLKIPAAVLYSSLSRSKIYELIDDSEIRSVCLRDKDKVRGVRLISRPSLEAYLSKFENTKSEPVPGRKGRLMEAGVPGSCGGGPPQPMSSRAVATSRV